MSIDPNAPAAPDSGLFGLDCGPEDARAHVLPVPFDATASYRKGAARGPAAILRASHQVDLTDLVTGDPWRQGIWMAPIEPEVERWNAAATAAAAAGDAETVNGIGAELDAWVEERADAALDAGKLVATLGGDHSVPLGAIRAHVRRFPGVGILHFDAHADLRCAYEGFESSHASILYNVMQLEGRGPIVQVGVRDFCEEELALIRDPARRIHTVFDHEWAGARLAARDLGELARRSLERLPKDVYVTFDVDGLDPTLCPGTGTPVPGGLSWHEAMLWLGELARSGRRIVGFDLTEVAPQGDPEQDSWDAIVGARLLYRLLGFALLTQPDGP